MPGQNQGGATVVTMRVKAAVTVSRGHAVILTATEDEIDLPGGTSSAMFFGFAYNDAAAGELVAVHVAGGVGYALGGGSIAIGDYLETNSTTGKVTKLTLAAANKYAVGKALRAAADGDLFPVKMVDFIAQGA